jgi:hypothetical protein
MGMPPCHSRRVLQDGSPYFFCAHPRHFSNANVVWDGVCQVCDLWKEPPPENPRPFDPLALQRLTGPCAQLGEQIGVRECPGCQGSVKLKVYACADPRHGSTTLGECTACPDFVARTAGAQVSGSD